MRHGSDATCEGEGEGDGEVEAAGDAGVKGGDAGPALGTDPHAPRSASASAHPDHRTSTERLPMTDVTVGQPYPSKMRSRNPLCPSALKVGCAMDGACAVLSPAGRVRRRDHF